MLGYAFFRLESALTIALILVLVVVLPQPFAVWQLVVLAGPGRRRRSAHHLHQPHATPRPVAASSEEMLREEYNPGTLRNPRYRERLRKGAGLPSRMDELVHETGNEILRERLAAAVTSVDEWTANMYRISTRLDAFESDRVIAQDMKTVPLELAALEKTPGIRTEPGGSGTGRGDAEEQARAGAEPAGPAEHDGQGRPAARADPVRSGQHLLPATADRGP